MTFTKKQAGIAAGIATLIAGSTVSMGAGAAIVFCTFVLLTA